MTFKELYIIAPGLKALIEKNSLPENRNNGKLNNIKY